MIRPAGTYKIANAEEMLVHSGSTSEFNLESFDKKMIAGYEQTFLKPVDDETLRDCIFEFMANESLGDDRVGHHSTQRIVVRWPHGRLENWFAAERTALECQIEVVKKDPKARGILDSGVYTIMSEEDYEYLMGQLTLKPETFWGPGIDELLRANWLRDEEIETYVVLKKDKMSSKRVDAWHEKFLFKYLKGLRLEMGKEESRVLLMHRPSGFVERRKMTFKPITQMGAIPCKIEDRIFPRWPQGDPLPEAAPAE